MSVSSPTFELVVRSGLHLGARQRLAPGAYLVGRSMAADIILADSGVADLHARLTLDADGCEVESTAGNVVLNAVRLEAEEARMARYPAEILLSAVQVTVTRQHAHGPIRSALIRHVLGAAAILVASAMVFRGLPAGGDMADNGGGFASRPSSASCEPECPVSSIEKRGATSSAVHVAAPSLSAASSRSVASRSIGPVSPAVSVSAAADALKQRLLAAGLTTVEVTADAVSISAKGQIDPAALPAWRDIEQWFDRTFGISVVLTSQVDANTLPASAPLTVQAIWAGSGSYVIDGRGQKLFEGSLVRDGWTVERIEQNRVVLRRGADSLAVSL